MSCEYFKWKRIRTHPLLTENPFRLRLYLYHHPLRRRRHRLRNCPQLPTPEENTTLIKAFILSSCHALQSNEASCLKSNMKSLAQRMSFPCSKGTSMTVPWMQFSIGGLRRWWWFWKVWKAMIMMMVRNVASFRVPKMSVWERDRQMDSIRSYLLNNFKSIPRRLYY